MGHTVTPKYAVEFTGVMASGKAIGWTPMGWNSRQAGRPTDANLATFVKGYEESTKPGGPNDHLGETVIGGAVIKQNVAGGHVVARYGVNR